VDTTRAPTPGELAAAESRTLGLFAAPGANPDVVPAGLTVGERPSPHGRGRR
jgi:hypothetical protein